MVKTKHFKRIMMIHLLMMGSSAFSAPVNQVTQQPITQDQGQFFTSFSLARSATLIDQQDGTAEQYLSANIDLSKSLGSEMFLTGSLAYEQNLKYPEFNDLSDIFFSFSHANIGQQNNWRIPFSINVIMPASKMSVRINSLQLGVVTGIGFVSTPQLFKRWILGANLSLGRLFHQYTTSLNGDVLNEYISNQSAFASYRWSQASLTMRILHRNAQSYFGTLKEGFEHSQNLSFGITPAINASIGHTNGGDIFKANGQDRNLSLINENASTYYMALEVNL